MRLSVPLVPADVPKLQPNSRENRPKSRYSHTHARESYAVPHSSQSALLVPIGRPDAGAHHPGTRTSEAQTGAGDTHFADGFSRAQGHRTTCAIHLPTDPHRNN